MSEELLSERVLAEMKILLPVSWLYALIIALRNTLFDWSLLKGEAAGVPVVSVGNLTVGGTGKTPLAEYIVERLLREGRHVAVVSRGYKRKSSGVVVVSDGRTVMADAAEGGDEPVQIARKFRDAIVVVGEKRVAAARKAVDLGADVIVLDDGFQHRYVKRDVDIVVVDSTIDITREAVIPAGRLREPVSGVKRADVVAFSRCDEAGELHLDEKLQSASSAPTIKYRYTIRDTRRARDDGSVSLDVVRRMQLLAFSGIGRHDAFIHELVKNGFAPVSDMRFSDHHEFSEGDVATILSFAKSMGVDACITTEKDLMRLRGNGEIGRKLFDEILVFYLVIDVEIVEGREAFDALILKCMDIRGNNGYSDN